MQTLTDWKYHTPAFCTDCNCFVFKYRTCYSESESYILDVRYAQSISASVAAALVC